MSIVQWAIAAFVAAIAAGTAWSLWWIFWGCSAARYLREGQRRSKARASQ